MAAASVQSGRGVIAAGHPLTAEAGAEMLRQGGNAFDAVVAAAFAACVTESVLTSLAGGGFLLAHTAEGENRLFDFFCQTPRHKIPADQVQFFPIQANFGDTVQEFHIGLGSVAVPGTLAGLLTVHEQLGRLPLKTVMAPAQHWATQGITVNGFQAYCYQLLASILTATPAASALYAPQGTLLKEGDRLYLPDFAALLDQIAQDGADLMYRGPLAEQIVQASERQGGYLRMDDLQQYPVIERQPLAIPYRDALLLTNPPPSSGGALIAFALELLATADLTEHRSPRHVATLREVMRLTNLARQDGYDAHLYRDDVLEEFLGSPHLAPYRQQLLDALQPTTLNKWGSTTHISVIDGEGNAVSMTTSNGEGSAYVIPGTGVMLNNMLGEEDLNPNGFHQWQPNQRISSMMAPTMVLEQGKPRLVLGSGGSNRIRTAILQVVSNVLDFGMDIEAAVTAPRIHWERGSFHLEPGYDRSTLEQQGIGAEDDCTWWQAPNMFFGGVHAVGRSETGDFSGIGDARRSGACVIVE
ncbi:gamma-glutamyltransferase [Leptolyngbya sp. BL0902]|uniref:gamma-glutamyltransferase n=1 Tax=Leptolyngbya sp. BL0902 TaxID=1115757 RepID=UPI0018E8890A|nr:gamma-glutamyltransferase [Leptolyngbya sp. BL0902]QQE67174.1 gamma-glutamyltransferase [Leptolyngbya sp. BL0902]